MGLHEEISEILDEGKARNRERKEAIMESRAKAGEQGQAYTNFERRIEKSAQRKKEERR